jgi:hypothetical protein
MATDLSSHFRLPFPLELTRVGSRAGENIWKMHTSAVQILSLFMKLRRMVIMFVSLGSLMDTEVSESVSSSPRPSHGEGSLIGKEVAKFCQVYFLRELTQIDHFRERQFDLALKRCFHRMDEMIEDPVSLLFFVSFSFPSCVCCLPFLILLSSLLCSLSTLICLGLSLCLCLSVSLSVSLSLSVSGPWLGLRSMSFNCNNFVKFRTPLI